MNQRNVEALRALLAAYIDEHTFIDIGFHDVSEAGPDGQVAHFVKFLAEHVVVPSALTEDDVLKLVDGWTPGLEQHAVEAGGVAEFIGDLERIAKGEA